MRQWKAQQGPAKEVFFAQVHAPGRLAASDFTSMNDLQVTIAGEPLPHLLYHFVLTHSNWEHVTLCFSESFTSLSAGLQNALWALGGVPQRHRTDRMTLAVHHDGHPDEFTDAYRALLAHYGLEGEATNPASGNENGDVESSHRHFKEAVEQALLLRGSRDFARREDYVALLQSVQNQRNAGRAGPVTAEMRLPASAACGTAGDAGAPAGACEPAEHDPGETQHLLGAGAVDRRRGRSPPGAGGDRGLVRPGVGPADAALARPGQALDRLPAHHRLAGA